MTSITEQTRSVSKSARALNSIMSSLSQVLDENSSNGKQIAAIYDQIGESMYDTNGQIKSGYDLLGLLSKHWGELNKNDQLAFANLIAGKNQLNSFLALMNNWDHAVEATTVAMESQGSAIEENERSMGGIQAKISGLKQSFQELSRNIINSDIVKGILDVGSAILSGLNTPLGQTLTTTTLLGGVFVGLGGMLKAGHVIDTIKDIGKGLKTGFKWAKWGLESSIEFFEPLVSSLSMVSLTGGQALAIFAAIAAAIAGGAALVDHFTLSYDEAVEATQKEEDAVKSLEEKIADLHRQEMDGGLTQWQQDELEYYKKKVELQKESARLAKQAEFDAYQRESGSGKTVEINEGYDPIHGVNRIRLSTKDVEDLNNYSNAVIGLTKKVVNGEVGLNEYRSSLQKVNEEYAEGTDQLQTMYNEGAKLSESQLNRIGLHQRLTEAVSKESSDVRLLGQASYYAMRMSGMSTEEATEAMLTYVDNVENGMTKTKLGADNVKKAFDRTKVSAGQLGKTSASPKVGADTSEADTKIGNVKADFHSLDNLYATPKVNVDPGNSFSILDTIKDKIAAIKDKDVYINVHQGHGGRPSNEIPMEMATGGVAKGGPTLVNEEGPELISANGRAYVAGNGTPVITSLPRGAMVFTADETKDILKGYHFKNSIAAYADGNHHHTPDEILGPLPKPTPTPNPKPDPNPNPSGPSSGGGNGGGSSGGGGNSSSTSEDVLKKQNDLFKKQLDYMEHKLFLMEKEEKTEEEQIEYIKKIQEEIERQKQWYINQGLDQNSKYIQDLEKQWWEYADKIKKLYKDQAKVYEKLFGAVANKAQDEINALNEKKKALQDQNTELQHQLELQKALDELARAKQQKVLVYKDGKMQYIQDADAVSEAQAEVERIQNERTQQEQLDAIDEQIKKWEEYKNAWGSVAGDYNKNQDLLLLEQKLGIKLEGENWAERLGNLQDYINKYDELMTKAGAKEGGLAARDYAISGLKNASAFAPANLYSMGNPTPASMMSTFAGAPTRSNGTNITIQNFSPNLPNVQDGQGFVDYLKNSFLGQTLQLATV